MRLERYRVLLDGALARRTAREPRGGAAAVAAADAATADDSAAGAAAEGGDGSTTSRDERGWWRHCERLYQRYGWRGTAAAGGGGEEGTRSGVEAEAEAEAAEEAAEEAAGEEAAGEAAEGAHLEAMAAGLGLSCGPATSRQALVRRSSDTLATLRATRRALEGVQPPGPSQLGPS